MVHVIKVYLEDSSNGTKIRRLAVGSDVVNSFPLLKERIRSLFQLQSTDLELKWKDSENDLIFMSTDGELAQALANADDGLLKLYVCVRNCESEVKQNNSQTDHKPNAKGEEHPMVLCDGCDRIIVGDRYKCLQCYNFDLCSACNNDNKHPCHDMIKLVKPSNIPREWVFLGARSLWRSMFNRCPRNFFLPNPAMRAASSGSSNGNQNESAASSNSSNGNQNESASFSGSSNGNQNESAASSSSSNGKQNQSSNSGTVENAFIKFLNGDFVPAQKLLSEGLGNFIQNWPGGVDIKLESDSFVHPWNHGNQNAKTNMKDEMKKEEVSEMKKEETSVSTSEKQDEKATEQNEKVEVQPNCQKNTQPKTDILEPYGIFADCKNTFPEVNAESTKIETEIKSSDTGEREKSPVSDTESATCAEGWTFLQEEEANKPEANRIEANQSSTTEALAESEKMVNYPNLEAEAEHSSTEQNSTHLDEGNIIRTNDPQIINALIKMQAMGFTNEGGWLERLLITKKGNINEALDALYPFAQRHQ
ncbi:sequestosome-1 [Nephila pilipes]|uniref:Sequestosome-1 n=1 Tax=Nephila pilipes TaxID=299642 RepID=A0A8X6UDE4_NEPPI|nr:sequestosome-1 [Nephila pilipes]